MNSAGSLQCSALAYGASIVQSLRWMISGGPLLRRYLDPSNRARIATHLQGIFYQYFIFYTANYHRKDSLEPLQHLLEGLLGVGVMAPHLGSQPATSPPLNLTPRCFPQRSGPFTGSIQPTTASLGSLSHCFRCPYAAALAPVFLPQPSLALFAFCLGSSGTPKTTSIFQGALLASVQALRLFISSPPHHLLSRQPHPTSLGLDS